MFCVKRFAFNLKWSSMKHRNMQLQIIIISILCHRFLCWGLFCIYFSAHYLPTLFLRTNYQSRIDQWTILFCGHDFSLSLSPSPSYALFVSIHSLSTLSNKYQITMEILGINLMLVAQFTHIDLGDLEMESLYRQPWQTSYSTKIVWASKKSYERNKNTLKLYSAID